MFAQRVRTRRWLAGLAVGVVVCFSWTGCGGPPSAKDMVVDQALAKQSLATALDAWKAGEKPAALKDRTPPIIVGIPAWDAGAKLTDYQIVGQRDQGANLNIEVQTTIEQNGQVSRRTGGYIVGTEPVITVMTE
jgi:hypothetical protein